MLRCCEAATRSTKQGASQKHRSSGPRITRCIFVDTEIDFEIAPIEFYKLAPPYGGLRRILHHHIRGTLPLLASGFGLLYALGTGREVGGERVVAVPAYCVGLLRLWRKMRPSVSATSYEFRFKPEPSKGLSPTVLVREWMLISNSRGNIQSSMCSCNSRS